MSDVIIRCIDRDAGLRVIFASTTQLVREAVRRHKAAGLGACALGRGLTSSLLLATLTKGGERVTVQIRGDGPLGGLVVDATDEGDVRGYLIHPEAATRPVEGRGLVSRVLGRSGIVNVMRDLGLKERYAGQTPLTTGEVDEDVEGYLRNSEQVPSALGCEVLVDDDATVTAAGGLLVQALPGATSGDAHAPGNGPGVHLLREAQHALRSGRLWEELRDGGASPKTIAEQVYGKPLELLDERPLRFQCRCSRERVTGMLHLLSTVELDEMIAEDKKAEVTCNFCNEQYVVGLTELEAIRADVAHGPREKN